MGFAIMALQARASISRLPVAVTLPSAVIFSRQSIVVVRFS